MTITRTTAKAAAFGGSVLLALSLSACGVIGGDDTSTPTTEAATTEAPTTEEPTSEAPASEEATTEEATTEAAESGDEPSRDELLSGLEGVLEKEGVGRDYFKDQGMSDEQIDQYFGCIVDEASGDLSSAGKRALASGDNEARISPGDTKALESSIETCIDKMTNGG